MSLALDEQRPGVHAARRRRAQRTPSTTTPTADVLVLIQSCNHCPYVLAWEGRMVAIQRDYADRGVRIVAFNSNDASRYPADSFDAMRERAASQGFNFDYLHDADQSLARALGSERTPEVFVFDRDRRLVYHGAIDDSRDEDARRGALPPGCARRECSRGDDPPVGETHAGRLHGQVARVAALTAMGAANGAISAPSF